MIAEALIIDGNPVHKATYLWGERLETIRYANGSLAYVQYNGHGDIVELRDENGQTLNSYTYDIWGKPLTQTEQVHNPFRYSGELWDDLGYTIDSIYGNANVVPLWDDPFFYVIEGGALIKGIVKGAAKILSRQALKKSAEVISREVAELGGNKIHHILQDKHLWSRVVKNPKDWNQVATIMSKTMLKGAEGSYKGVFMRTLRVGNETVVVTYTKLPNGIIKISDGWVAK